MSVFSLIFTFFSTIAKFMNNFILTNKMINELFNFGQFNKKKKTKNTFIKDLNSVLNDENKTELKIEKNDSESYKQLKKRTIELNPNFNVKKHDSIRNKDIKSNNQFVESKAKIDIIEEQKKIISEKNNFTYHLPFYIKLKSLCCKRFFNDEEREPFIIFTKGIEILKENTNILSFLKKFDELNEMKFVLFNKIQAT